MPVLATHSTRPAGTGTRQNCFREEGTERKPGQANPSRCVHANSGLSTNNQCPFLLKRRNQNATATCSRRRKLYRFATSARDTTKCSLLMFSGNADAGYEHELLHRPNGRPTVKAKVAASGACPDRGGGAPHGIQAATGRRKDHTTQQLRRDQGGSRHAGDRRQMCPSSRRCKYTTEAIVRDGLRQRANYGSCCTEPTGPFTIPKSDAERPMPVSKPSKKSAGREEALAKRNRK